MPKKSLLSVGLVVSMLGVAACSDTAEEGDADPTSQEESAEGEEGAEEEGTAGADGAPEPDLEDVPDVVAVVNGQEILKDELVPIYESQFQQRAMQAQMSGQEIDQDQLKQQTVEGMVDTELAVQEADSRGLAVSDDDIDAKLNELAQQNGLGSAEEFMSALNEQGVTEEDVTSQLESQLMVEQLVTEEAGDTEPTEDELRELYDQMVDQQEQMGGEAEIPSFDEARPQLEEQVKLENESEVFQALVEDLRADADVTVNL